MVLCLPTLVNLWEEPLHNRYLPAISSQAFFATTTRICNGIWHFFGFGVGSLLETGFIDCRAIILLLPRSFVKEISSYKCDLIRGYLCFIRCTATVFAWEIRLLAASSPSPSNIQTFIYNLEVSIGIVDTNQVTFRPKLFD